MSRALIILGKGASQHELGALLQRWPEHELWTLNDFFVPGSTLHWDIHYDARRQPRNVEARQAARAAGVPIVISPFLLPEQGEIGYPLAAVFERWRRAYFELTLDYMLAYAITERDAGRLAFDVLATPGCDCEDLEHFACRAGAHFWLGVCVGLGIALELPGRSLLLRRALTMIRRIRGLATLHEGQPLLYGQPEAVCRRHWSLWHDDSTPEHIEPAAGQATAPPPALACACA